MRDPDRNADPNPCGDFDCGDSDDVTVHFHANGYGYICNEYGDTYACADCGATHRHTYTYTYTFPDRDAIPH